MARETVAVDPDHVDVARAAGDAFLDEKRALVHERPEAAKDDLLVGDLTALETKLAADRAYQRVDFGIGHGGSAPLLVSIPAGSRLLAEPAHLAEPIRDL